MKDYIVRATAAGGQVRAFAITARELVEEARARHNTSPVATAALGRLLAGGAMMGSMMKNDSDMLTVKVRGNGPLGGITVTADSKANVKGYVENPDAMLPPKNGKLDVGGAVGIGILQVIKDMGLKEPYVGDTMLVTSEIAEDLTYYFASSELLDRGCTPEQILEELLGDTGLEITDTIPARFYCNCSKERVEKAVASIGREDIQEMIGEGKDIEVKCHFCNSAYTYTVEDLRRIMHGGKR